jgi:16S rRNA processing protein RimM
MAAEPFTPVGRVARTHGLKGEVSVIIDHDASLDAFLGLDLWIVPPPAGRRTVRVRSVRPGPKGPLFAFDDVSSIDEARTLAGRELLARSAELPETVASEPDEDLLGYLVVDDEHGELGSLVEVIVTGANDVWVVEGPFGEVLLPVIDDVVISTDERLRRARVRLLPGLLPEKGPRT